MLQLSFKLKNERTPNSCREASTSKIKSTPCHSFKPSTMGMKWHESFLEKGQNGPISWGRRSSFDSVSFALATLWPLIMSTTPTLALCLLISPPPWLASREFNLWSWSLIVHYANKAQFTSCPFPLTHDCFGLRFVDQTHIWQLGSLMCCHPQLFNVGNEFFIIVKTIAITIFGVIRPK